MSRPTLPPSPARRTSAPTPTRPHAACERQAQGGGAVRHRASHHPTSAPTPKAQTPTRTRAVAQTPNHPRANTPTSKPQQARPQANTRNVPTQQRVGTPSVSAGTRVLAEATGTNEAQTHDAGTQTAHTKRAQTTWFAPVCACARKGGQRERRAAHNSPRQSAWVVVFVGVFADVCRRFWAGWFGVLGVFWGCLACFLVF